MLINIIVMYVYLIMYDNIKLGQRARHYYLKLIYIV